MSKSRRVGGGWIGRYCRHPVVWLLLLGAMLSGGASLFDERTSLPSASGAQSPAANPAPHPLDQPLQWMHEAAKINAGIRDYTCYLIKQERVKGTMPPEHVIAFKYRAQPFSVYMKWLAPAKTAGQEVAYIHGQKNNKMHVRSKEIPGFLNGMWISPTDSRVREHSRHSIYDAGLGKLIDTSIQNMELERRLNKTQVKIAEYTYNNRRCWRIEGTRTERNSQFYSYRSVVYIDKETKLPIRAENYDWPRQGSAPDGELFESFSFVELRFDAGLTDADFKLK